MIIPIFLCGILLWIGSFDPVNSFMIHKSSLFTTKSRSLTMKAEPIVLISPKKQQPYIAAILDQLNLQHESIQSLTKATPNQISLLESDGLVETSKPLFQKHEFNSIYLWNDESTLNEKQISQQCKFNHYLLHNNQNDIQQEVKRFKRLLNVVSNANKRHPITLEAGLWSHFLSLTCGNVQEILPILPELRQGIDAFELRVDLLQDQSSQSIHRNIALLREHVNLPIVYTVRTKGQIGQFPDDQYDKIEELLIEGLRAGVEWLDVEANLPKEVIERVGKLAKDQYGATTRLLGSLHTRKTVTPNEVEQMYQACDLYGYADMLKVVTGAEGKKDCYQVHEIGQKQSKPYIGLCLGQEGSYSRVLNQRFTPVTHPLLAIAAPGQLSAKELIDIRLKDKLFSPKQFYLFGTPIQHSLSPKMHNNAFHTLNLPHQYSLAEEKDVSVYQQLVHRDDFGGASVTIPHKENIIPYLTEVCGAANDIKAVNTIVVDQQKQSEKESSKETSSNKLYGYNTDWLGMYRPISQLINKKNEDLTSSDWGLVVGAGGTARAACKVMKELGLNFLIANREPEKTEELAKQFQVPGISLAEIPQLAQTKDLQHLKVVISSIPPQANFTLPDEFFQAKPVILDVVYKPALTSLLQQAKQFNSPFVQGATMLLEQGIEQFQLWNQRAAPREEMTQTIFSGVEKIDST